MNPMKMLDDMRTIKQLLTDAERIAREMGQEEPGAEHLLLSAIALPDGSAGRALSSLGVDADRIRAALRDEQADALVAAGMPRERAEGLAEPEPLSPGGAPVVYAAGPSAQEVFQEAGRLARASKQRLAGAHVVAAIAVLERGTMPRVLDRLGVDREQLADAARVELGAR
jgi:ATP-dependent Clp protease ATP-binding subunit ClpA